MIQPRQHHHHLSLLSRCETVKVCGEPAQEPWSYHCPAVGWPTLAQPETHLATLHSSPGQSYVRGLDTYTQSRRGNGGSLVCLPTSRGESRLY